MSPDPAPAPRDLTAEDAFVRALTRKLTADPELADDAAQETWLKALQHAQAPGLFAAFGRGWFAVVARNAVLQSLRGSERRQRREQAIAMALDRDGAHDDAGDRADAATAARLLAAVRALPPEYRDVVHQRFFEDRLPVEIADALGVPVETVRTRLKRALQRLRTALAAGH